MEGNREFIVFSFILLKVLTMSISKKCGLKHFKI